MNLEDIQIMGVKGVDLQPVFKEFIDSENEFDEDMKIIPKKLSIEYLMNSLSLSFQNAKQLHTELVSEGFLDSTKFTPTTEGMALANANGLPRIPLSEAKDLLEDVIRKANEITQSGNYEVKIESIELFGSVKEETKSTVGDIDLFIKLKTPEGDAYLPEHMYEEDDIVEELQKISPYISFHGCFDEVVASACKRRVYP